MIFAGEGREQRQDMALMEVLLTETQPVQRTAVVKADVSHHCVSVQILVCVQQESLDAQAQCSELNNECVQHVPCESTEPYNKRVASLANR